ncbi:hypothetical protein [Methylobacterium sp. ID0610]|uniref:hypothetical protein n=1 Tax=Methylobacterium carpenticola TaxID=3344827 RepID=UPI003696D0E6
MTTQETPPIEDTLELREQLASAWRAVLDNAVERGSPPQAVVETMASVAHERFAELFGASAAASYLQLLSEQLRNIDHDEAAFLVRGEEAGAPATEEPLIDPVWINGQELI